MSRRPLNQPQSRFLAVTGARRTVEHLLGAAARRAEARTRAAVEKAERERQQLARAQAAARARYLDGLVGHVDELWQQVEALVATKRQTDYDAAVRAIQDLHDLAARRRTTRYLRATAAAASGAACKESQPARSARSCAADVEHAPCSASVRVDMPRSRR